MTACLVPSIKPLHLLVMGLGLNECLFLLYAYDKPNITENEMNAMVNTLSNFCCWVKCLLYFLYESIISTTCRAQNALIIVAHEVKPLLLSILKIQLVLHTT